MPEQVEPLDALLGRFAALFEQASGQRQAIRPAPVRPAAWDTPS